MDQYTRTLNNAYSNDFLYSQLMRTQSKLSRKYTVISIVVCVYAYVCMLALTRASVYEKNAIELKLWILYYYITRLTGSHWYNMMMIDGDDDWWLMFYGHFCAHGW